MGAWKAALLGALLMAPFAVGAYLGLRSVLKGFRGGWVGLAANLVLGVLAIGMPIAPSPSQVEHELAQGCSASSASGAAGPVGPV